MKRAIIVVLSVLILAAWSVAQAPAASGQQPAAQKPAPPSNSAPAQAQPGQAGQMPAPAQPAQPQLGKPQPQPKSQDEYQAFTAVFAKNDPAAIEAGANDFATKFPDSNMKILLYMKAMGLYQETNNAEKCVEMGRKTLALDPKTPEALVTVATVLSERTRETDLDRDERLAEATKDANSAIELVDSLMVPPNTPPERVEGVKKGLISMAYSALGTIDMTKKNFPSAEQYLKKSIDAGGTGSDPVTYLRLAVVQDQLKKYTDALAAANKAVELSPPDSQVGNLSKQERDRLLKVTGAPVAAPAPGATAPPGTAAPKPQTPGQQVPPSGPQTKPPGK